MVRAYFGDRTAFKATDDIAEHASWLLPSQDADEDDGINVGEVEEMTASIEEIARRKKREFVGVLFLWENGLIGVACEEPVCKFSDCLPHTYEPYLHQSLTAVRISFEPTHPRNIRNPF